MNLPISGKFNLSFILLLGYFGYAACSAPKPLGSKNSSTGGTSEADALPDQCSKYQTEEADPDAAEEETAAAFRLVAAPDVAVYDAGVKPIIDGKCATNGCHTVGGTAPDMSDFTKAKAAGIRIIARSVTASSMPFGAGSAPLNATEKDILQTWLDNGFPPTFIAPPVEAEEEEVVEEEATDEVDAEFAVVLKVMDDQGCTGAGCHNATDKAANVGLDTKEGYDLIAADIIAKIEGGHFGKLFSDSESEAVSAYSIALTGEPVAEEPAEDEEIPIECQVTEAVTGTSANDSEYSKTLNPPKLTECQESGFLYDRLAKDCHAATLGTKFDCNWEGVSTTFSEIAGTDALKALENDKFQVDQCGELDGNPVVLLLKTNMSAAGELTLDYKTLTLSE